MISFKQFLKNYSNIDPDFINEYLSFVNDKTDYYNEFKINLKKVQQWFECDYKQIK